MPSTLQRNGKGIGLSNYQDTPSVLVATPEASSPLPQKLTMCFHGGK